MKSQDNNNGLTSFESKFGASALGVGIVNLLWGVYWSVEGSERLDKWTMYNSVRDFIGVDILGVLFILGSLLFLLSIVFVPSAKMSRRHNAFLALGSGITSFAYIVLAIAAIHHDLRWIVWAQAVGLMASNALLSIQGFRQWRN